MPRYVFEVELRWDKTDDACEGKGVTSHVFDDCECCGVDLSELSMKLQTAKTAPDQTTARREVIHDAAQLGQHVWEITLVDVKTIR